MISDKYDIYSDTKKVASVWWDEESGQIESDSDHILSLIKRKYYGKLTFHDGPKFLRVLPKLLSSGYFSAKRSKDK